MESLAGNIEMDAGKKGAGVFLVVGGVAEESWDCVAGVAERLATMGPVTVESGRGESNLRSAAKIKQSVASCTLRINTAWEDSSAESLLDGAALDEFASENDAEILSGTQYGTEIFIEHSSSRFIILTQSLFSAVLSVLNLSSLSPQSIFVAVDPTTKAVHYAADSLQSLSNFSPLLADTELVASSCEFPLATAPDKLTEVVNSDIVEAIGRLVRGLKEGTGRQRAMLMMEVAERQLNSLREAQKALSASLSAKFLAVNSARERQSAAVQTLMADLQSIVRQQDADQQRLIAIVRGLNESAGRISRKIAGSLAESERIQRDLHSCSLPVAKPVAVEIDSVWEAASGAIVMRAICRKHYSLYVLVEILNETEVLRYGYKALGSGMQEVEVQDAGQLPAGRYSLRIKQKDSKKVISNSVSFVVTRDPSVPQEETDYRASFLYKNTENISEVEETLSAYRVDLLRRLAVVWRNSSMELVGPFLETFFVYQAESEGEIIANLQRIGCVFADDGS